MKSETVSGIQTTSLVEYRWRLKSPEALEFYQDLVRIEGQVKADAMILAAEAELALESGQ